MNAFSNACTCIYFCILVCDQKDVLKPPNKTLFCAFVDVSVILYTKSIFLEKIKLYNFDVMRSNSVSNFVFFNSLGILRE